MKSLVGITSLLFLLCSLGCTQTNEPSDTALSTDTAQNQKEISWSECSGMIGDHPCDFTFLDQDSQEWNLYDQIGDVILLDFSTMWCSYCRISAQDVERLHDQYSSSGFQWVTLLVDDTLGQPTDIDDIILWADTYNIEKAPVLVADRSIIDSTGETGYPVNSWPTFILINRDMTIAWTLNGWSSALILEKIEETL